jgi:hypothetical protein
MMPGATPGAQQEAAPPQAASPFMMQLVRHLRYRADQLAEISAAHVAADANGAMPVAKPAHADGLRPVPKMNLSSLAYDLNFVLGGGDDGAKVVLARLPDGTLAALKMRPAQQALEAFCAGRVSWWRCS